MKRLHSAITSNAAANAFVQDARARINASVDSPIKRQLGSKLADLQRALATKTRRRPTPDALEAIVQQIEAGLAELPRTLSEPATGQCGKVITLPQFQETCWFNALLMVLFYSERMRSYLLDKIVPTWVKRTSQSRSSSERTLLRVFEELMRDRHTVEDDAKRAEVYRALGRMRPEHMITLLNKHDSTNFKIDPRQGSYAHRADEYISQVMRFLGVKRHVHLTIFNNMQDAEGWCPVMSYDKVHRMRDIDWDNIDIMTIDSNLEEIMTDKWGVDPATVVATFPATTYMRVLPSGQLDFRTIPKQPRRAKPIEYHVPPAAHQFVVDGLVLFNFNQAVCGGGHEIAGVTCGGERYIYNGRLSTTNDASMRARRNARDGMLPCLLSKYDWLQLPQDDFCISPDCGVRSMSSADATGDMCFNVGKGRMYIAIKLPQQSAGNRQLSRRDKKYALSATAPANRMPRRTRPCDLGYVVADHIALLMRLFEPELREYNMRQAVTKCLNTAVMMMYVFLGQQALKHTRKCEVPNVQGRYRKHGNQSLAQLEMFERNVLNAAANTDNATRTLYYVMLTDADLPHAADPQRPTIMFPGHVFVIDKVYNARKRQPSYNLYQSYINQYDMNGAMQRSSTHSLHVSHTNMRSMIAALKHLFTVGVWDDRAVQLWNKLSFVDSSEFLGHRITDHIYFCYSKVDITHCSTILQRMVKDKLKRMPQPHPDRDEAEVLLDRLSAS